MLGARHGNRGGGERGASDLVDGKASLNVSVSTNGDLSASTESWQKTRIESAAVEDDGTVTLTVPAPDDKGFMILKSKAAK